MYKVSESTWVDFWRERGSDGPVYAETRMDLKYAGDIDIDTDQFTARFLVYLRVRKADLYGTRIERKTDPTGAFVLAANGDKIEEFWPWLEFNGTVKSKTTWSRDKGDFIVFGYDVEGVFSTADNTTASWYPFDFHSLGIKFTSNWDSRSLRFVPWDGHWTDEMSEATLTQSVSVVDAKCCRFRNSLKHRRTLHHMWISTPIPRLTVSASDGFTGRYVYSEAEVSIFVNRRISYHSMYEVIRPLALGILCPFSLSYVDDRSARLSYNVSLIVAMSFAFLNARKRIVYADFYRLAMFVFASLCLLFAITPDDIPDFVYALGAWGLFALIHGLFALRLAMSLPARWREWNAHRNVEKNSMNTLVEGFTQGIASLVSINGAADKQRKIIRQQTFGDED